MKVLRSLAVSLIAMLTLAGFANAAGKWTPLKNQPTFQTDTALLLTDGTVIVHEYGDSNWWRLTPDNTGSYLNGKWSQIASLPSNYGPLYFASAVLPDGRVLVEGGEYNFLQGDETNLGAIYDPVKDKWTAVNPPSNWTEIGDSPSVILDNGTLFLGQNFSEASVEFNAKKLTWKLIGTGKADTYAEEGLTLLPDGTFLTVDTQDTPNTERYNPKTNKWSTAGDTPESLAINSDEEIGPSLLRPQGNVFAMGANGSGAGHTALYTPSKSGKGKGKWAEGPDFPGGNDMADAPAAVLPNGNILCDTSPGIFESPVTFYEFNGTKFTNAPSTKSPGATSYEGRMLVVPTGQVLFTVADGATIDVELYTGSGKAKASWAPTISSAPSSVTRGKTYKISGTQFNGLTQAAAYGDDGQMATNYPLVRITNNSSGHVFYARTHDPSSMGVATGSKKVSVSFDVSNGTETGASSLVVVANGNASKPVNVTVQ